MLSERDLSAAIGSTAQGPDGEKIGTVESFFVDDRTGAPTWVAVSTGLFGTRHSIVPATQATFADGVLRVPVSKDAVRHAPAVGGDHLGPDEEAQLRQHYGLGQGAGPETGAGGPVAAPGTGTWAPSGTGLTPPGAGQATDVPATSASGVDNPVTPVSNEPLAEDTFATRDSGATAGTAAPTAPVAPVGDAAPTAPVTPVGAPAAAAAPPAPAAAAGAAPRHSSDGTMIRSEEQLRVGTEQVAATRVRVVKYVVTEEVQVTVPLRREEIRIEHVPLDAPDPGPGESLTPAGGVAAPGTAAGTGTGLGTGLPDEIVLHAERPVVGVEVVPVERVRLRTDLVQGQEQVSEQVQREQIVVDQTPATQAPQQRL
ncbi:stress response protein YsnF [Geodermatophilus bullaregiensis]|uniref:PRC and DUF2382 domain-containing protein n=1 Tax=Geodermatophilus bullaregiensis TaxID=1564160 RepID=UPI00195A23CD|nr:PRC and DUF2382 domain-containing protein [Geodermatophilus bullaregiensis]MBM7806647.1 stress response protein YsnF [Geodermatophilus bullaregiensis]